MTALSVIEHNAVAAGNPREVLTCRLGQEDYGIDILSVQEIRRYEPPVRIANAASYLRGFMDLRGVIVPIVDLRRRLNLPAETGVHTVTVVVNFKRRTFGLVVDSVADVVALGAAQIQPRPSLGSEVEAGFVVGLAQIDAGGDDPRLLLLVDLAALLRDL